MKPRTPASNKTEQLGTVSQRVDRWSYTNNVFNDHFQCTFSHL